MRFTAEGPSIPDELLEDRDRGRVVFFCGAGISMPAGLPSFAELARRAMLQLGTPDYADSHRLLHRETGASLDRVFNHLYEEYRRDDVDSVVRSLLRTPPKVDTANHETILRISSNTGRQPQVVTTNFDLIFERARPSLETHVAPALPNIASLGGFSGLVYLHGRLSTRIVSARRPDQLVLSSSDFGRAYLANGWATNFVRELLQTYVIVLVGYSASDPPIRYLLEGLRVDPRRAPGTIYSFDCGTEEDVSARWATLGVRPIAYGPVDHTSLWDTLAAWAERADSPERWRQSVVTMATADPRLLQPHQRGQVASLVRTSAGAAQFADAPKLAPSEWLCVFDSRVRRAAVTGASGDLDPLLLYGLDDDPPRREDGDDLMKAADLAIGDLFSLVAGDERTDQHRRLAGTTPEANDRLPKRLASLCRWFGRVSGQRSALWWAAGNRLLHRGMVREVEWALQYRPEWFSTEAKHAWQLLLQRINHLDTDRLEFYQLKQRVTKDGWDSEALRAFGVAVEPHITAERAWGHRHLPAGTKEDHDSSETWISFDVAFLDRHGETTPVPAEWLPRVFEKVRAGLQLGSELLALIRQKYWQTTTFYPSVDGGDHYPNEASEYLRWCRELFDRLASEQPDVARDELRRWPTEDQYFFDKLRSYAWGHKTLCSATEVADGLVGLWEGGFWNEYHRRELLHTLRARWADFELEERKRIEARIIVGPPSWLNEDPDSFQERKLRTACALLGWLDRDGCELTSRSHVVLSTLRETLPEWHSLREERADQSHDIRVGSVTVETEPGALIDAPISELAVLAQNTKPDPYEQFTRHAPFQGVVERSPRKALLALSFRARHHQEFPPTFGERC